MIEDHPERKTFECSREAAKRIEGTVPNVLFSMSALHPLNRLLADSFTTKAGLYFAKHGAIFSDGCALYAPSDLVGRLYGDSGANQSRAGAA